MGLVKRKVITKANVNVEHFEKLKKSFLQDIRNIVVMDEIPNELIINLDQTGLNYVPVSQWTMEVEGAKCVQVDGKDDKCQITAVLLVPWLVISSSHSVVSRKNCQMSP